MCQMRWAIGLFFITSIFVFIWSAATSKSNCSRWNVNKGLQEWKHVSTFPPMISSSLNSALQNLLGSQGSRGRKSFSWVVIRGTGHEHASTCHRLPPPEARSKQARRDSEPSVTQQAARPSPQTLLGLVSHPLWTCASKMCSLIHAPHLKCWLCCP